MKQAGMRQAGMKQAGMKQALTLVIFAVFMFGVLFPVSNTSGKGRSLFFEEIKKFFHYYPEDTKKPKVKKTPTRFKKEIKKQLRYHRRDEK